jgi:DNA-binding HxlR family transcriptional regulator
MRELACGPLRPADLGQRLPAVPHSAIMLSLGRLARVGAVIRDRRKAVPRETFYSLPLAGIDLLDTPASAARWARSWSAPRHDGEPLAVWPLRLIADARTRAVLLGLADTPLSLEEIHSRCLPGLSRSAVHKRLARLVGASILHRFSDDGAPLYALSPGTRRLGFVAITAARWEWTHARPNHTTPAANLADLLHLIAPVTHIPDPLAGILRLHVDCRAAPEPDIYLVAEDGHLIAPALPPTAPPVAEGHATPQTWCDAVLGLGGNSDVKARGDRRLVEATLRGVKNALCA